MRRLSALLISIFLVLCLTGSAWAASIVDQDPHLAMFQNFTTDSMVVQFDRRMKMDTASPSTIWLSYEAEPTNHLEATISFETRDELNDTILLTPTTGKWPFAKRLLLNITSGLTGWDDTPFDGDYPFGQVVVFNVPDDLQGIGNWDPTDPWDFEDAFVNSFVLLGYNPLDPENTDTSEPENIPGMSGTEAWKISGGRPDVLIAVIDTGIGSYAEADLADNFFLNKEELPYPTDGGATCSPDPWDCNDDGRFNVRDYDNDPTFAGLGRTLSVQDLIDEFSDGLDGDGNGFVDDISGWDFHRNANEALGAEGMPESDHGEGRCKDAAAIGNNGTGSKPGFCPYCTILPIRTSDAIVGDVNNVGAGVAYANMMGADVAVFASGAMNFSEETNDILTEASYNGTTLVGVVSDEMGYHHAFPGSYDEVISVKAIFPITPIDFLGFIPLNKFAFVETTCTMWGEGLHLTGASLYCSSDAAGNTAGVAGLLISRARDLGLELTANEIKQMLTMSADDIYRYCITLTGGGCQPGWDAHYGYGRVNAKKAIDMLGDPDKGVPPRIPPEVRIMDPEWFAIVDPVKTPQLPVSAYMYARGRNFSWDLQIAEGKEPKDGKFQTVASGNGGEAINDQIASVDITGILPPRIYNNPPDFGFDFTVTLRLQVTYTSGETGEVFGEDRRTFAIHRDQNEEFGLIEGFPYDLGASGEGAIKLYDLDGAPDNRLEIIASKSTAEIVVLKYEESTGQYEMMDGFPLELSDFCERDVRVESIFSAVAVGDLFGNGTPYIVAATTAGAVYVIDPRGNKAKSPILDGFPVYADEPDNSTTVTYGHGIAFGGSPVLADLDRDGVLEIVAACFDGKIYAWKPVDGDGDGFADRQNGFPVLASSIPGNVPNNRVCLRENDMYPPQILGTPVVGVYDPNHEDPDIAQYPTIFIGTSEVCDDGLLAAGRFYAIFHDGYDNDSGSAFLPEWPIKITGPLADALPIPPLTIGITSSPSMARFNDKTYLGISTILWIPQLFVWDGEKLNTKMLPSKLSVNVLASGSFGRLAGDDQMHYVLPTTSFLEFIDGWISLLRPMILAWDIEDTGKPAFFTDQEDSNWLVNPSIADISGDGVNEMIAGTGGFQVHAYDLEGNEPEAWPKFTYNWSASTPSVGDIDNDGLLEVFQHTREGELFAWNTAGEACHENGTSAEWWTFHHDEHNSGTYGIDTIPPFTLTDLDVKEYGNGAYTLSFTTPGDDWACGTPKAYDIRYASSAEALSTPEAFYRASQIDTSIVGDPAVGGVAKSFMVNLNNDGLWFAAQVVDDEGNLSLISTPVNKDGPADDDDDDDDSTDDDADDDGPLPNDDDDDDDDEGCGC